MAALVARAVEAALPESATASTTTTESHPVKNFEIVIPKRSVAAEEFEKVESQTESPKAVEVEDEEEEMEPIEPAYYYDGGKIPVFTPTMEQFKSFKKFVDNINHYGMESGIVKVIPPKEWSDALPPLDEKVKEIKIKNPIEQHIVGNMGEYRQTNIEKQRTYNLPEWRALCEGSNHQPPAKRGERRKGQPTQPAKRSTRGRKSVANDEIKVEEEDNIEKAIPPTPESPVVKAEGDDGSPEPTVGRQPRMKSKCEDSPKVEGKGGRQPRQSKRRTVRERREAQELADEAAYEGFDYRMLDADQFTPERCQELEKHYWKTLTYNSPLYGADMPGSLFDDTTESWNVAKLDNLLDCLGKKLPGVNTAYLYLGMWKSTFSWHLEDMDLYSINYIHFGAPKQWYSISRKDKERFENIMRGIWPNEAKKCSQFLRHKTFLVSPSMLQQQGIKVNKLVHHQGEFVITFPFGYHSGYNIGYNCAESVNFAQRSWLEFARDAKKCECIDDAVFVDVDEIERKLRGEPTEDEYESDEDDYGYYDEDEEGNPIDVRQSDFPTPPESVEGTKDGVAQLKKRKAEGSAEGRSKKARIKIPKPPAREPCVLCPNDLPAEPLLYTENGTDQAHRLCAIYTPETYFKWDEATNREIVANVAEIPKARLELKCVFCRSKKGSCFQCSAKKCTRAYHATCAAAAGVLVNMVDVEITGEDGKTYAQTNIDYRCKIHRPKRPKDVEADQLESDPLIRKFSTGLVKDDIIQMQYFTGDIFAGVVQENRVNEETVLVKVLPRGDQLVEVEWKWILPLSSENNFPDAITTAPLYPNSSHNQRKAKVAQKDIPDAEESFGDEESTFKLGEIIVGEESGLEHQEPIKAWWYYLGEQSTEYISKFTGDPKSRVPNPDAAFLAPKPPAVKSKSKSKQPPYGPQSQYGAPVQPGQANFQNHQLRKPDHMEHGTLPQGYRPAFHDNSMIGYGPPPRDSFRPAYQTPGMSSTPPQHNFQSPPYHHDPHSRQGPPYQGPPHHQGPPPPNGHPQSGPPPPHGPQYSPHTPVHNGPPPRRGSVSLHMQQLLNEAPPPPHQQRPQYQGGYNMPRNSISSERYQGPPGPAGRPYPGPHGPPMHHQQQEQKFAPYPQGPQGSQYQGPPHYQGPPTPLHQGPPGPPGPQHYQGPPPHQQGPPGPHGPQYNQGPPTPGPHGPPQHQGPPGPPGPPGPAGPPHHQGPPPSGPPHHQGPPPPGPPGPHGPPHNQLPPMQYPPFSGPPGPSGPHRNPTPTQSPAPPQTPQRTPPQTEHNRNPSLTSPMLPPPGPYTQAQYPPYTGTQWQHRPSIGHQDYRNIPPPPMMQWQQNPYPQHTYQPGPAPSYPSYPPPPQPQSYSQPQPQQPSYPPYHPAPQMPVHLPAINRQNGPGPQQLPPLRSPMVQMAPVGDITAAIAKLARERAGRVAVAVGTGAGAGAEQAGVMRQEQRLGESGFTDGGLGVSYSQQTQQQQQQQQHPQHPQHPQQQQQQQQLNPSTKELPQSPTPPPAVSQSNKMDVDKLIQKPAEDRMEIDGEAEKEKDKDKEGGSKL